MPRVAAKERTRLFENREYGEIKIIIPKARKSDVIGSYSSWQRTPRKVIKILMDARQTEGVKADADIKIRIKGIVR